jgi:glutamine synthetase
MGPGQAPISPAAAQGDYVLRTVEERGVRFVRLWFVDVLGLLKSIAIPVSELEYALAEGVGIDGSSLEGMTRLRERDAIAYPDPTTFQVLPWRPGSVVARMHCDVRLPDGAPYPGDSRHALRRVLGQAADLGYSFQVGPEIEFFLFDEPDGPGEPRPLDDGTYFDLTTLDDSSDFRRRTIEYLEQLGIPVKESHHELAASQHEVRLHHTDALSMADAVTTFRVCVKEVARELEMHATFMPKPSDGLAGSGMHLHLSLFDGDSNAFYTDAEEPLSELGRSFLAGILAHAGELTLITNQWLNSYKRLASGFEAPQRIDWARRGSDSLVRVPSNRPGREAAARIELRSPDPGCNPYLALALLLAAGLNGIERGYLPPAETNGEPRDGFDRLPQDLREAVDAFDSSQLARETLGDVICDWIVRNKRRDWETHRRAVTELERRSLLRLL